MKKVFLYLRGLFRSDEDEYIYRLTKETKQQSDELLKKLDSIDREKIDKIMRALDLEVEFIIVSEGMHEEAQRLYPGLHESSERAAFIKGVKWQFKREANERGN